MNIEEKAKAEGLKAIESSAGIEKIPMAKKCVIRQPNGLEFNGIQEYIGNIAAQAYTNGAKVAISETAKWLQENVSEAVAVEYIKAIEK